MERINYESSEAHTEKFKRIPWILRRFEDLEARSKILDQIYLSARLTSVTLLIFILFNIALVIQSNVVGLILP